jgi:hypothetical protein
MKYLISLSFLLIVLLGCQAAPTTALPTLQPTAVAQVTVITVTSVPPTPILVPTATPTATAVPPTATPLPPITIAVAPQSSPPSQKAATAPGNCCSVKTPPPN